MTPSQTEAPAGSTDQGTAWFGVAVGLSAWGMFFAALAFSVGYLRMREPWPLAGMPALPKILPALAVQGFVLSTLWSAGLKLPQGGAYASAVYGVGALHGAHVVAGLVGGVRELVRGLRGAQVREALQLWSLYGAFLAVTGLILFMAVYLP